MGSVNLAGMPDHVSHLPFGTRPPTPDIAGWDTFPFEGDLRVKPIEPPVLPEPPRHGAGGIDCHACARKVDDCLWGDDDWMVTTTSKPSGVPAIVFFLQPRAHHDLGDLPPRLAGKLGVMIQRVERAYLTIGGIARVHMAALGRRIRAPAPMDLRTSGRSDAAARHVPERLG